MLDNSSETLILRDKNIFWLLGYIYFYSILDMTEKDNSWLKKIKITRQLLFLVKSGFVLKIKHFYAISPIGRKFIERFCHTSCEANKKYIDVQNFVVKVSLLEKESERVSYFCEYIIQFQTNSEVSLLVSTIIRICPTFEKILAKITKEFKRRGYKIDIITPDYDPQRDNPLIQISGFGVEAFTTNKIFVELLKNNPRLYKSSVIIDVPGKMSLNKFDKELVIAKKKLGEVCLYG